MPGHEKYDQLKLLPSPHTANCCGHLLAPVSMSSTGPLLTRHQQLLYNNSFLPLEDLCSMLPSCMNFSSFDTSSVHLICYKSEDITQSTIQDCCRLIHGWISSLALVVHFDLASQLRPYLQQPSYSHLPMQLAKPFAGHSFHQPASPLALQALNLSIYLCLSLSLIPALAQQVCAFPPSMNTFMVQDLSINTTWLFDLENVLTPIILIPH